MTATGFDLPVVQLFDHCCRMWLHLDRPVTRWFGHEVEVAAEYARFLSQLADHLGGVPDGGTALSQ